MNLWDKELPTKENLNDWSNTIKKFVLKVFVNDNSVNFNLSYLNALLYHNFLNEEYYYSNYQYLQYEMLYQYNNKIFKFGRKSFIKFFAETLKKDIKDSFKINDKIIKQILNENINTEIYKELNILFNNSYDITGFLPKDEKDYEKYLKEICSYLSYAKKNIKDIPDYKNSYIEKFFKDLSDKIKFSKELIDNDFKEHLNNAIDIFNIFFNIDIDNQNLEKKQKFIKESQILYQNLENCFKSYDFAKLFDDLITDIENYFLIKINTAEIILEENENDIEKAATKIVDDYKILVNNFQGKLK